MNRNEVAEMLYRMRFFKDNGDQEYTEEMVASDFTFNSEILKLENNPSNYKAGDVVILNETDATCPQAG